MPYVPPPIRPPQKPVDVSIDAAIKGGEAAIGIIVIAFVGFFIAIAVVYWLIQLVHYCMRTDTIWILFASLSLPIFASAITELYLQVKKHKAKQTTDSKEVTK